ncbi:MAG: hypothetical protein WCL51_05090, partial [Bacteroidota bacterium]
MKKFNILSSLKISIKRTKGLRALIPSFMLVLMLAFASKSIGQTASYVAASFTTTGNSTWVCPTGVTSVVVECIGAGGGGGGTSAATTGGSGGAGGSYSKSVLTVVPGTTYYLTVGTGGTAGSNTGGNGGTGGNSFFGNSVAGTQTGATCAAVGGAGGNGSTAGNGIASGSTTGNVGSLFWAGGNGGTAVGALGVTSSGGGGGGAGSASVGGNSTTTTAGTGGTGTLTGGAGAVGKSASGAGAVGTQPGGGGGGGYRTSSTARAGGAGGAGKIVINVPYTPISSFPWTENFDGMSSIGSGIVPTYWSTTTGTYAWASMNASSTTYNLPYSTPNYMSIQYSNTTASSLWAPAFQLTAGITYVYSFYYNTNGTSSSYIGFTGTALVNSSPTATGSTPLGTFITATQGTAAYTQYTVNYTPATSGIYYFGINVSATSAPWYLGVDNFSLKALTPILSAGTITSFGNVCYGTTTTPKSFTLTGTTLTTANVTVGPLYGFNFSTTAGGTYTPTLTLTPTAGAINQTVYVEFSPDATNPFDGSIPISGGGAPSINVAAVGTGVDSPPSLSSGTETAFTASSATITGSTISATGCSDVFDYGIEWSYTNNFTNGTGTMVSALTSGSLTSGSLLAGSSGAIFSTTATGLTPGITYYYHAYATNDNNTSYSNQGSFTLACATPTDIAASVSSSNQTISTISGSFTAAATAPTGYLVVRTTGNVMPTPLNGTTYSVGSNAIGYIDYVGTSAGSWMSTGLTASTLYYYWIFSYNTANCSGGPLYSITATQFNISTTACTGFAATISINGAAAVQGVSYPTITSALSDLSVCGITQPTILELASDYVASAETYPITLGTLTGQSATNTITIREASGVTGKIITSNNTIATINIVAGSYWKIDGRSGGLGAKDLTISNTSTATGGSAIRFITSSTNNVVEYVNLIGSYPSATSGVVLFGAGSNNHNIIDNCSIDGNAGATAAPTLAANNGVYSSGTSNDTISITNCTIFNTFVNGTTNCGVLVSSGTAWTISGNSFYQTATRTTTTASSYYGISINNTSGNNYTISNNYIGGSAANCGSTAMTIGGTVANLFRGIDFAAGTTTASGIQGNTIANINFNTSSGTSAIPGIFAGIYASAGSVNIGTVNGNTIGSTSGTSSISITSTTTAGLIMGIYSASNGNINIEKNSIGSIAAGGGAAIGYSFMGIGIAGTASATVYSNNIGNSTANNISLGINGTTTAATAIYGIYSTSTGASVSFGNASGTGNTFQNMAANGSSTTSQFYGIYNTAAVGTLNANYNTFTANSLAGGGSSTTTFYYGAILNGGAVTGAINMNYNSINSGTISTATYTGVLAYLVNLAGASTSTLSISNNTLSNIDFSGATGSTSTIYGIYHATGTPLTETISNNNFNNLSLQSSGAIYLIYNSYAAPANGTKTIQNNVITTGFTRKVAAAGSFYCYYDGGANPATASITISGNNFSNISTNTPNTVSYSFYGIYSYNSSYNQSQSVYNNTLNNISFSGNSSFYGYYLNGFAGTAGSPNLVYGNTLTNITGNGTATSYGMYIGSVSLYVNAYNNLINNITLTGAASIYGIYNAGGTAMNYYQNAVNTLSSLGSVWGIYNSSGTTVNIYQHRKIGANDYSIYGLSSSGAAQTVIGIYSSSTTANIYKNKVYNLTSTYNGTYSGYVYGFSLTGGTTVNTYNNIIGKLTAPAVSSTEAIRGISITSSTSSANYNVYNNTIYLNATSTGANFGSSGIYHATSATATTAALDLRNNIIVNTSTATGTGISAAYRRSSSTLTNYASTSNFNCLFGTNIMYDGATAFSTLAQYRAAVGSRDATSINENPNFISTNGSDTTFLRISSATQTGIESGGSSIVYITDDIDGDIRQGNSNYPAQVNGGGSAPDIGADEFDGKPFYTCVTPTPGNTLATSTNICLGTNVAFSLQNVSPGTGITYKWQSSSDGTTYTNISGATSSTYSAAPTAANYYQCIVTCQKDLTTGTSTPVLVSFTNNVASTTGASLCGVGSVNLLATASNGTLKWYNTATNGTSIGTGSPFTTPIISSTTTYYVGAETSVSAPGPAIIGTGTNLTSSTSYPTVFGDYWYQNWQQLVYTATELQAQGLVAGNITSIKFNVSTLPALAPTGFSISMGATSNSVLTAFQTTGLTNVYSPATLTMATGWNIFTLSTPYLWDGVSNILVDLRMTEAYGSASSTCYYSTTTGNTVLYAYTSSNNTSFWTSNPTPTASTSRLNAGFTVIPNNCSSPRVPVAASVISPPTLTITGNQTVCSNSIATLSVTSDLANYNSYVWTPITNLYTDAAATIPYITGENSSTVYVKENQGTATTYTCNASNVSSQCVNIATSTVTTTSVPVITAGMLSTCSGGTSTITTSPATGYGASTFQWQNSSDSITFTDISSATSINYTTPIVTGLTYYHLIIKNGVIVCSNSNNVTVFAPQVTSTTPNSRCGIGTVNLAATGNGTLNWYNVAVNGTSIGTSSPFTTPSINSNTTYYVDASIGSAAPGSMTFGTGTTTTSTSSYPTLFSEYGGYQDWQQLVYTAAELRAQGLAPGNITSLKFNVASLSIYTNPSAFTISIGSTPNSVLSTFQTTGLTTVYGPVSPTPTTGWNTFTFTTPYNWDGISNILVDIRMKEAYADAINDGTYYTATSGNTVLYAYSLSDNSSFWTSNPTPTPSNNRFNAIFTGQVGSFCYSSRVPVIASVTAGPAITPIATPATICHGSSSTLSVSSSNDGYTYSWTPTTTPTNGASVTASPLTNTVYTVTANDNSGGANNGCSAIATVNLTVITPTISGTLAFCEGSTTQLTGSGVANANSPWVSASPLVASISNTGLVTGLTGGTSIITYTDTSGCQQTTTITVHSTDAPSLATATPSTVCIGSSTNLNAVSTGNTINWYDAAIGGNLLGSVVSGLNFQVTPTSSTTYYADANSSSAGTQTFDYSGSIVNWTVPANVTSINVTAKGAQGGNVTAATNTPGKGAVVNGTFAVTPGQVLSILVGQQPTAGSTFSGGGGGTFVALGSSYTTATPMIVAGGGGGASSADGQGGLITNITTSGDAGGPVGYAGTNGNGGIANSCSGGGGGFYTSGGTDLLYTTTGLGGTGFRQGGAAVNNGISTYASGGFGGGSCADYASTCNTYTGNGGGYSGGGGNDLSFVYGGAGGGSYNIGTNQTNTAASNTGNGQVIISYNIMGCTSLSRTAVPVIVDALPTVNISGITPICEGTTTTLSPVSGGTWVSNKPSVATVTNTGSVSGVSGGTSTFTFTDATTGCSNTTSNVTIKALPSNITISPALPTICSGSSELLTASGGTIDNLNSSIIGTGTTINGVTSFPAPYTNAYGGNKHQMLVKASELTALGIPSGAYLTSVSFNVSAVGASFNGTLNNFQVDIGATAVTALNGTTFISGLTNVIPAGTLNVPITGLPKTLTHTFTTPFVWDGTNNIVIQTSYSNVNGGTSATAVQMTQSDPGFVSTNWYRADGATAAAILSATTPTSSGNARPNMIIGYNTPVNPNWSWSPDVSTTATLNVSPTTETTYTVTATINGCSKSQSKTINIDPFSVGGTAIAANANVCTGSGTTVTLSGNTGSIQWEQSANGNTGWVNVTGGNGATSATYTTPNLTTKTYYRALVTSGACSSATSSIDSVNVNSLTTAGVATVDNSTICYNSNKTITLTAYNGTSIQWQESANGTSGWANVTGGSGETTATYNTANLTAPAYFRAVVTNGACPSANSSDVSLVFAYPTAQPTDILLATGINSISGSFVASASADHYLIVRSTLNTLSSSPINGTVYNTGDLVGGGMTAVGYQTGTSFTDASLLPNTQYYYYIFAANNNNCNNGPVYLVTAPLTGSTTTLLPQTKTLLVTAMLQEYFNTTTGLMNQTLGINWDTGDLFKNFSGTTVDTVMVLIRKTNINADVVSSFPIDTVFYGVNLNNNGLITISLSAGITGY